MPDNTEFSPDFLWGAATAAHQVEGHQNNNWSEWEPNHNHEWMQEAELRYKHLPNWEHIKNKVRNPDNYISGDAADHYHRYSEDIGIMQSLGLNSYRFSIEWSRIEPEPGEFDMEAINHYRQLLQELHKAGLEPFVSLHHFSEPVWLEEIAPWHSPDFPDLFARYVDFVVGELGDLITYWVTFNEPESYLISRYLDSPLWPGWPHQEKSFRKYLRARRNFVRAHKAAYTAIKQKIPNASAGFAHSIVWFVPKHWWAKPLALWLDWDGGTGKFRHTKGYQDFIAVQYYMRNYVTIKLRNIMDWAEMPAADCLSDFGWEIYPEGLYYVTQKLKRYDLPIYITENGIADREDALRADFIKSHIEMMHRSMRDGADIRGYFYWSLLDNYEWSSGFWPRFGLVEVDYATKQRRIRDSAYTYSQLIRELNDDHNK